MSATCRALLALAALGVAALTGLHLADAPPAGPGRDEAPPAGRGNRYALLVGVTRYEKLGERYSLDGPASDVALFRSLLVGDRFRFPDANVVTLAESLGRDDRRPTLKNIKQQFAELAMKVGKDDEVVVLLSGHGTQQPEPAQLPNGVKRKPTGQRQVFLPADAGKWNGNTFEGGLLDFDLAGLVKRVTAAGAFVWVIADCCHSGTILRSPDAAERQRLIQPTDLGIPALAFQQARAAPQLGKARGFQPPAPLLGDEADGDRLVGVYACLPEEVTVEKALPDNAPDAKYHGILTFSLCQELARGGGSRRLTYRELVRRIDDRYRSWGRKSPTPLVEGKAQDREVLGIANWQSPPFRLTRNRAGGPWQVDGGRLAGLTPGSVLSVYAPEGPTAQPAGHVRVARADTLTAEVEPCEHAGLPATGALPDKGRCDIAYVDYGDLRLGVAVAATTVDGKPVTGDEQRRWRTALEAASGEKGAVFRLVPEAGKAKWLVSMAVDGAYLIPADGVVVVDGKRVSPYFGPYQGEAGVAELKETMRRIARAEQLVGLTGKDDGRIDRPGLQPGSAVKLDVEVIGYKHEADKEGQLVPRGAALRPGDLIAVRVHNRTRDRSVYPTILFVDGGYGIDCLYPEEGQVVQLLPPGQSFTTDMLRLKDDTFGVEQVVVIGVRSTAPVDFSGLKQPTIEKARAARVRGHADSLETPLGRLIANALYADGGTRGLGRAVINDHDVARFSWYTVVDR